LKQDALVVEILKLVQSDFDNVFEQQIIPNKILMTQLVSTLIPRNKNQQNLL